LIDRLTRLAGAG